jgi:hypothetical protein
MGKQKDTKFRRNIHGGMMPRLFHPAHDRLESGMLSIFTLFAQPRA